MTKHLYFLVIIKAHANTKLQKTTTLPGSITPGNQNYIATYNKRIVIKYTSKMSTAMFLTLKESNVEWSCHY